MSPKWLLCVVSLLATVLPAASIGPEILLKFNTGTVVLQRTGKVVHFNFTGLGCKEQPISTIHLTSVATSITESHLNDEPLFYTDVALKSFWNTTKVQGFMAVRKSQLGNYKYLPYRMEDIGKILSLTLRTNMTKLAEDFGNMTVSLSRNASCPSLMEDNDDLVCSSSELTETGVDLVMAILLEAVSYNRFIEPTDGYFICKLDVKYTDMPWVLERCCGEATHRIYDSDTTYQQVICHNPDHLRTGLSQLALCIGTICFLFSPLLVKYVPEDPYQQQKKAAASMKRRDTNGNEKMTVYFKCCGRDRYNGKSEEGKLEMKNFEADTHEAEVRGPHPDSGSNTESLAADESRVYLSLDPEHKLSLSTVLAYIVYLPPRHHLRSLLYRFLVMAAPRFLCSWLWVITQVYYESVVKDNPVMTSQGFVHESLFQKIYSENYKALLRGEDLISYYSKLNMAMLVYVPLIVTVTNMLLLSFLVVRPRDICQALVWKEKEHREGTTERWGKVPSRRRDYSKQLYDSLMRRLSRVLFRSFWRRWWNGGVCMFSPLFRTGASLALGSKVELGKQFAYVLLMFPVQVLYALVHSLPCCSVLNNLYTDPATLLSSGRLVSRNKYVKLTVLVIALVMTAAGVFFWYWVILVLCWFGAHIVIFLSIDILRNASTTLSSLIFACSVLLYVESASARFQETYRRLKLVLFEVVETYPDEYILKSDGKTRLYTSDQSGYVSIPRCLFDEVCKRYHPYRHEAFKTLTKLLLTLCSLAIVFIVLIELGVFDELTTTGDGVVMAATASVPAVLGMVRSDTEKELRKAATVRGIQTMIENMFELQEDEVLE